MKQPEDNKTLDLFTRSSDKEIQEVAAQIVAFIRGDLLTIGMVNYGRMRPLGKPINTDFTGVEHRILGSNPLFAVIDELVSHDDKIDTLMHQLQSMSVMDSLCINYPETEPKKKKKAKWKDDKTSFGRLNQSYKAKGLK